jgi:hypothetical protein
MHPEEKMLAAALLDLAADRFSNHSCNDLSLGDYFDNSAAVRDLSSRYNGDADDDLVTDWVMMQALAERLREEARMEGFTD